MTARGRIPVFHSEEERIDDFTSLWKNYTDRDKLVLPDSLIDWLKTSGFFTAPASSRFHGAYPGGLYDHSAAVFVRLQILTDSLALTWDRPESPFVVGMFHDICKIDQYVIDSDAPFGADGRFQYERASGLLLQGHGDKSVMLLSQFITLTEEEMLCIRYHMGAYEKDDWGGFDLAIKKYPNVLMSHAADQLASKVDNV